MKTLLTLLLTFLLINNAYACALMSGEVRVRHTDSLSFTSPKECSNMLNTTPNKEISSSLVSKYGNCINSHFSKIIGKTVDGKVKFFPYSGYVGMNIVFDTNGDSSVFMNLEMDGTSPDIEGIYATSTVAGVPVKLGKWVSIKSFSDYNNPFEWYASSEDDYNFIHASKHLGWRMERNECPGLTF